MPGLSEFGEHVSEIPVSPPSPMSKTLTDGTRPVASESKLFDDPAVRVIDSDMGVNHRDRMIQCIWDS